MIGRSRTQGSCWRDTARTMSQENVEIVRSWFAALANGELAPELWHPDLVVDNTPEFPITGPYCGHEGLQTWWDDLSEVVDGATVVLDEVETLDRDRILTVQRITGTFSNTRIPVNAPWIAIFVVREEKLQRVSGFSSRRQALKAVGLSE